MVCPAIVLLSKRIVLLASVRPFAFVMWQP
jgi:hypothetical protein